MDNRQTGVEHAVHTALDHIRHLSVEIGGRGSCTPGERLAAEYAAACLERSGASRVRVEDFQGVLSTYRPFAAAFAAALLGAALQGAAAAWLIAAPWGYGAAALLSALGAWAMLAETDLASNWARGILPRARSCNAVGVMSPTGAVEHKVVLCAHLDTHRTPVFYSSPAWNRLFTPLIGGAWLSMALAALLYAGGTLAALSPAAAGSPASGEGWLRAAGLAAAGLPLFALLLCLHAEATPYSPGANDNASGVGVLLAVAERLALQPLQRTEVWLAFTGCEEVGDYGIAAFLDAHARELGPQAVYLMADQVGIGRLTVIARDGLVIKRPTHPVALEMARRASARLPGLDVAEQTGLAYTDALMVTRRGGLAIPLVAIPRPESGETNRWHQMSDTLEHLDPHSLQAAHTFTWELLQVIDEG